MNLIINGESKEIKSNEGCITLEKVIKELGHDPRLVVVEFNGSIKSPKTWSQQEMKDGDILEIVTIVGGGS